jgi:CO/xanthine dehydrogenase FAD-binding subunit
LGAAYRGLAYPGTVEEALGAVLDRPDALLVAGGTALMPRINTGELIPRALVFIDRIEELRGIWFAGPELILGSATTCADLTHAEVRAVLPALAQSARAIGSAGLRSRATIGGNLVAGKVVGGPSPATPGRDLLPVLVALGATAVCRCAHEGWRQVPIAQLYSRDAGVDLRPGELLTALRIPISGGPQGFMKISARGGAGRTVVSFALAVDLARRTVTCAVGGLAPAAIRVDHAGAWLAEHVDWADGAIPEPDVYSRFAKLVAEGLLAPRTAGPAGLSTAAIPDDYRRDAAAVCARRALVRALPPAGWLEQVRQYQQRAEFIRHRAAVDRAEKGLPQEPPLPRGAGAGPIAVPGGGVGGAGIPRPRMAGPSGPGPMEAAR